MTNIIQVSAYTRRKPLPSADFIATTKALAAHVLSERECNEFVGEMLATELSAVLPRYVEQDRLSQFPEDMQTRVREGGP